jgi:hypothetical protein
MEQSGERIGGRFGVRFCANVIEMSGIGAVLHPGEMNTWLRSGIPYPFNMDRWLGVPILRFSGMNPSLVPPLLCPSRMGASSRSPLLRFLGICPLLAIAMYGSGAAFLLLCGRNGTRTVAVFRGFSGSSASGFLH